MGDTNTHVTTITEAMKKSSSLKGREPQEGCNLDLKLDFSWFDRENLIVCVYKASHYFVLHPMPNHQKILMSSFYMEGDALV